MRAKKRDYKDEYKKFQSSPEKIAYRVDLNRKNRESGTYGNGDGLYVSHQADGSTTMEGQSTNRGRNEKSRLKGWLKRKKKN